MFGHSSLVLMHFVPPTACCAPRYGHTAPKRGSKPEISWTNKSRVMNKNCKITEKSTKSIMLELKMSWLSWFFQEYINPHLLLKQKIYIFSGPKKTMFGPTVRRRLPIPTYSATVYFASSSAARASTRRPIFSETVSFQFGSGAEIFWSVDKRKSSVCDD